MSRVHIARHELDAEARAALLIVNGGNVVGIERVRTLADGVLSLLARLEAVERKANWAESELKNQISMKHDAYDEIRKLRAQIQNAT